MWKLIKWNFEEVEAHARWNGVSRNRFETLPRITVLSHAILSTVLDLQFKMSIASHTNTNAEAQNKSQTFLLSLFQIRSSTDLTALIKHKASIYGPRPKTNIFRIVENDWKSRIVGIFLTLVPD